MFAHLISRAGNTTVVLHNSHGALDTLTHHVATPNVEKIALRHRSVTTSLPNHELFAIITHRFHKFQLLFFVILHEQNWPRVWQTRNSLNALTARNRWEEIYPLDCEGKEVGKCFLVKGYFAHPNPPSSVYVFNSYSFLACHFIKRRVIF